MRVRIWCFALLAPLVATAVHAEADSDANAAVPTLLAAMSRNDYAAAAATFTADAAVTPAAVARMWRLHTTAFGACTGWQIVEQANQDDFVATTARFEFTRGALQCLITTGDDALPMNMFCAPPAPPPSYVDTHRFSEQAVVIGPPPAALNATLTLPSDGQTLHPAVVLVHGSGPNDRDETVGATKMFRDLAQGLASAGIAVLRYDKRTFAYRDQLSNTTVTIDNEVIADAIAATRLLAATPGVDPKRIYIVGHSLGAMLAPEIAQRAGSVAGAVLLAPPARAPWDIVVSQMRYLGAPRETIAAVERTIVRINLGDGDGTTILGVPFAYWRDWANHNGIAAARTLARPLLILHGDRDYQVLDEDLRLWKAGLVDTPRATIKTLPGLNHVFVKGSGPSAGPNEYLRPNHVDASVIEQIKAFVLTSS